MTPFDAELHLRLLGERGLVQAGGSQQRARDSELFETARALIAVGAIELADAAQIVEGYGLAEGLRHGRGLWRRRVRPPGSAAPTPESRRTVLCSATLERPTEEIHVRSVTLSPSETRLSVVIRTLSEPGPGSGRRIPARGPMRSVPSYTVSDDRGGRSATRFSGGGGDLEWRGHLTANQPLAMETAWIELDGTRIELIDAPSPCTVGVEPVAGADPAHRYLWHWLAAGGRHGQQLAIEPVLDALIAAGQLRADDPQLAALRHVSESRGQGPTPAHGGSAPAPLDGAPPEWRSLLEPRPARRSPRGAIALVAVTPPFDGITVTVDELTADEHGWQLEVEVTPGIAHGPFGGALDQPRVAWWAVDDLGQYHLGHFGAMSGGPHGSSGTLELSPGLDRAATRLTLLPTGPTERARIELSLDWSRG